MSYRVCGLTLETDILFPELPRSPSGQPDCVLVSSNHRAGVVTAGWNYKSLLSDGYPRLLIGQCEFGRVLRFPQVADFTVPPAGKRILWCARPRVPKDTVRHLFLDFVLPAYLSLGRSVLHASVVRVSEKSAIAFLGGSGSGKSTLAACLLKEGYPVVADDCAVLELGGGPPMCIPSYPGLRLWDDSAAAVLSRKGKRSNAAHYTRKKRFQHRNLERGFDTGPIRLTRVYYLEPEGPSKVASVSIHRISGSRAFITLLQSSFRLNFTQREPLLQELDRLKRLAESNLLYGVSYPRDFHRAAEVTSAILNDISHLEVGVAQSEQNPRTAPEIIASSQ